MISEDRALAHAFELYPELQGWDDSDYQQAETEGRKTWMGSRYRCRLEINESDVASRTVPVRLGSSCLRSSVRATHLTSGEVKAVCPISP
jgi:hypothetical protein